jgi:16S rRNA (guanine527-N7)-methyltransferase
MEKLRSDLQKFLGLRLSDSQLEAFSTYEQELMDWNSRINLTAIRTSEGIRSKHFLDSLSCLLMMRDRPVNSLIDIGTGAGFPGLPLKIVLPDLQLTLVESVGKKADFCQHVVNKLGLKKVTVVTNRAEALGQSAEHREKYDWALARAVANLNVLSEYLLPLVKVGGAMLAQKGDSGPSEAQAAQHAMEILGGKLKEVRFIDLPGVAEERSFVLVEKVHRTPANYPRHVGVPTKTPLK